jgi:hypothetical protein
MPEDKKDHMAYTKTNISDGYVQLLTNENNKLRAVLQRVRRWGSPMVKGYIDGALGGNAGRDGHLVDGEVGEIREQEEKG